MGDGNNGSPVLVTGATGYIGGRLVPRLLDSGRNVRCLVRDRRKIKSRPWAGHGNLCIVEGDVGDAESLQPALSGCSAAYYLVHSMVSAGADYAREDRRLAGTFAHAAANAGVSRLIYLGGLGETGPGLSRHLQSRREVESELASAGVPVTVLRAAMIIGAGSASFEILRYLVERLPIMVTPRWVHTQSQPIAVSNVLHYLTTCLDTPETTGRTLDIGGPDVLTYREIMDLMAEELGVRRRVVIPVPVLTPRLSSLWIHLITPVGASIARPLAEGLRNRVVCRDNEAERLMPQRLLSVRESIQAALVQTGARDIETSWTDAGVIPGDPDWAGGTVFTDSRTIEVSAPADAVFSAVCRVGGGHGYYAADLLWRIRGWMDIVVGGPGLRRGRRHPDQIGPGDALDFWRVRSVEADRRLDLRAEMRLPGTAELSFEIDPGPDGLTSRLTQTARFRPRGLLGILYWYCVLPLHGIVFSGMLRGIRRQAEQIASTP